MTAFASFDAGVTRRIGHDADAVPAATGQGRS
jgi:hypothetical protein